ncbi:MAG: cysteine desulfurase [Nanoarchaeota archaeon]|nr:cysteine desulfurase [Nanoarchaeota archaeon]MBU1321176.1 cysteine desulfurase [Nanoarchaeota archaeon]MBU1598322.1 cysteine desulfurase [Nanoarchaeota archaeon]MBU2441102.1 cysteine desulfurase [Nanoarchaeota archaeon]
MNYIYLDNAATTPVDPKVLKAMMPYYTEKYGNASSGHTKGREAKDAMERARKVIARSIGAKTEEIIFTSGGTESNNMALKSIAFENKNKGNHIIVSKIEHDCVVNACKWLEKQGFKVTYLDVNENGFVRVEDLEKAITKDTLLVSIIHGNNEIGTIQDLKKLGEVCKKHNVLFHTDTCQSYTKVDINVNKMNLDLVTLNAHKIHGPKGIGALYIRNGTNIKAWQHGGGHERNLRSGTENIHGIVGFAEAVKQGMSGKHVRYMTQLRDKLIKGVLEIPEVELNGPVGDKRLCNNANFYFKRIEGEAIGGYLDLKGIASSTGSACSAHTLEPSHVLLAIGRSKEQANGSIRLSISRFTTEQEIDYLMKHLPGIIKKLRLISPL